MSKRSRPSDAAPPPPDDGTLAPPGASRRRVPRKPTEGSGDPVGTTFAYTDKAATVSFSRDRRTATSSKGYRLVRTTAGVSSGCWYFEFTVSPDTRPGSHFRLGLTTDLGESHGPVGYTHHSYAYRDVSGSRVHQSIRSPYGRGYGAGDVIGVLLDFHTPAAVLASAEAADGGASAGPADGARQAAAAAAAAAGASKEAIEALLHCADPPKEGAIPTSSSSAPPSKHTVSRRWWGSSLRFFLNGEDQGIAFVHLTRESRLLPAASMYSGGSVRINPGPVFAHPPSAALFPQGQAPEGEGGVEEGGAEGAAASSASEAPPPALSPLCSPWRPFSDTEASLPAAATGLPSQAPADGLAASSTLLGTGLLRGGPTGAYNFANTEFAFAAGGGGKKEGGGRSRKRK